MTHTVHDNVLSYDKPPPRTSRWALGVFVASIVAAVAFLLVLPSLIVWPMALLVRNSLDWRPEIAGRGFAHAAVQISGYSLLLGLVVQIFIPSTSHSHRLSNRSVCAANLRGTVQSMNVYASDFNDAYPIVSPTGGYSLAAGGGGTPAHTAEDTLKSIHAAPAASVTQNMWLLVLTGQVAPKQFLCKDDPASQITASPTHRNLYQTNFNTGKGKPSDLSYSYSFAYMWQTGPDTRIGAWWKNTTDASLPLIADMAPLAGTGKPAATPADPKLRNANSFSHQRDGQNVGFGDAHAEFARLPNAGQGDDNIYTFNGGIPSNTGKPHTGTAPGVGDGGVPGAFDICMVPAADGKTNARR